MLFRKRPSRKLSVPVILAATCSVGGGQSASAAPRAGDKQQPRAVTATAAQDRLPPDIRRARQIDLPATAGAPASGVPGHRLGNASPAGYINGAPANAAPASTASLMQQSGGSLLRASMAAPPDPNQPRVRDVSFFSVPEPEPKTIKKHDLVTIIIREESAFSSKGKTDTKRESEFEAKLEEFIKLKLLDLQLEGGGIGPTPPSIKFNSSRSFKGEGKVDRTDSLTARITGEVLDVKPNGTLVVQARKQIKTDDEQQIFVLTGICRAEDVTADNSILSTQMFDLRLEKNTKGAVRGATRRGWLGQILDAVAPF